MSKIPAGSTPTEAPYARIVMSKTVASAWLQNETTPEYRFQVFNVGNVRRFVNVLRSFRDHKFRLAGVQALPDLGVKPTEDYQGIHVWSKDLTALKTLHQYFAKHKFETTWIW
jgi:hypothetical protein